MGWCPFPFSPLCVAITPFTCLPFFPAVLNIIGDPFGHSDVFGFGCVGWATAPCLFSMLPVSLVGTF